MKVLKLTPKQALNGQVEGTQNILFIKEVNKDLNLELHFKENADVMNLLSIVKVIRESLKSYEKTLKDEKVNATVIKKMVLDRKNQLITDLKDDHGNTGVELVRELMTKGSQKFIGGIAIERTSLIVTVLGKERNYKVTKELLGLDGLSTEKEGELLLNKTTTKDFLKTSELEDDTTVNFNKFLQEYITEASNKISEVRKGGLFFDHMKENTEIATNTKNDNNKFLCSIVAKYLAEKKLIEKK